MTRSHAARGLRTACAAAGFAAMTALCAAAADAATMYLGEAGLRAARMSIEADLARGEIRYDDGGRAEISEKEGELLAYLARNPGRAVSRDEILSRVWRIDPRGGETRTIDMHVARLREKLRDDPAEPKVIRTVRGKGYALGEECAASSA